MLKIKIKLREQPKGFRIDLEKFHNKKWLKIKKKGANLGDLVKNPFKRGMPF